MTKKILIYKFAQNFHDKRADFNNIFIAIFYLKKYHFSNFVIFLPKWNNILRQKNPFLKESYNYFSSKELYKYVIFKQ